MKKRILSLLLILCMAVSLLPTAAFAAEPTGNEASIGTQEYATLAEAVKTAKGGETVTLLKNVTVSDTITIGKLITIDGNNNTITAGSNTGAGETGFVLFKIEADNSNAVSKSVTIQNCKFEIPGNNDTNAWAAILVERGTLSGLTIQNNSFNIKKTSRVPEKGVFQCIGLAYMPTARVTKDITITRNTVTANGTPDPKDLTASTVNFVVGGTNHPDHQGDPIGDYSIQNLSVTGNTLNGTNLVGVDVSNVNGLTVTGNTFNCLAAFRLATDSNKKTGDGTKNQNANITINSNKLGEYFSNYYMLYLSGKLPMMTDQTLSFPHVKYEQILMDNAATQAGTFVKVGFDANGGKFTFENTSGCEYAARVMAQSTNGTQIDLPTPIRDDWNFDGWKAEMGTTSTQLDKDANNYNVTDSVKFVAQWSQPTTYTVTYTDGVDGEEIFKDQVTGDLKAGDKTPAFNGTPTREGYKFTGWTPAVADTVSGNATYTAQWEELTYTVTYTDGVDGEEIFKDQVIGDLKAGENTPDFNGTPTREGYKFTGWTPAVADTVTGNVTYTAQWEKQTPAETFTVTYTDGRGRTWFKDEVHSGLKNGDKTPAYNNGTVPIHDGYIFKGWLPAVDETVTKTVTYTAQWESKSEHLIKELLGKIKVECINTISGHKAAEYDTSVGGYSAVTTEGANGKFTSTITVEAAKYVAKYNEDTKVTHRLADGEVEKKTIVVEFDSTYSKDSVTVKSGTLPVVFKVTCAQPQPDPKYTLTYNASGGTLNSGMTSPVTDKKAGDTVDLDYTNQPTHEPQDGKNVIFIGWTRTDTKEKVYANGEPLPDLAKQVTFANSSITVYAVWGLDENSDNVPDALEAKVTYKIDNGQWFDSSSKDPDATVTSEDKVAYIPLYEKNDDGTWVTIDAKLGTTIPTGHRGNTGYISDGWYKDAETTRTEISAATAVTGNVTYTFKYVPETKLDAYTVVLHLDGGAYTAVPAGYTAGSSGYSYTLNAATDAVNPNAATLNKSGYEFKGWSLSDTAPQTLIGTNETFASLSVQQNGLEGNHNRITLYAVWDKNSGGGGGGGSSTTYYYFAIEKIDAQDSHTLNGAKFGLYLDGKQIATATSNRSGIAMFRIYESDYRKINAKSDLYYQELTAPEGYVVDSDEVSIEKSNLTTSWSKAEKDAETVRNYRGSTPDLLNGDDHFAYVVGYQDGCVHPNALITRAETATIFFRLLKDEVRDGNLRTSNTFADVADHYWANTAISTMAGLGIVQGRSSTAFDPNASITRAEFAAICARFDTGKSSGTQTFSDIKGHWAQSYIERAAELGWIKGFEDGTFRPDDRITRAQAMTMINRVLNRIPEDASDLLPNMNVWPDCNPGDWFYLAVQEATNSHNYKHKAGNYETWTSMKQDPDWTRYEK